MYKTILITPHYITENVISLVAPKNIIVVKQLQNSQYSISIKGFDDEEFSCIAKNLQDYGHISYYNDKEFVITDSNIIITVEEEVVSKAITLERVTVIRKHLERCSTRYSIRKVIPSNYIMDSTDYVDTYYKPKDVDVVPEVKTDFDWDAYEAAQKSESNN
jgi:hypothetical protein